MRKFTLLLVILLGIPFFSGAMDGDASDHSKDDKLFQECSHEGMVVEKTETEDCMICAETFPVSALVSGDQIFGCDAGHKCCSGCLGQWIISRAQKLENVYCPACRAVLMQNPNHPLMNECFVRYQEIMNMWNNPDYAELVDKVKRHIPLSSKFEHILFNAPPEFIRFFIQNYMLDEINRGYNSKSYLMHAARFGNESAVRAFLEVPSVKVNTGNKAGDCALSEAVRGGNCEVVALLLQDERLSVNIDILIKLCQLAVRLGVREIAHLLFDKACSLDTPTITPLMKAAASGLVEKVEGLLNEDAFSSQELGRQCVRGNTPLLYALGRDCLEITQLLLDRMDSASVEIANGDGVTPLMVAIKKEMYSFACNLIEKMSNDGLNKKTHRGLSALTLLMSKIKSTKSNDQLFTLLRAFIIRFEKKDLIDSNMILPLFYAIHHDNKKDVSLLLQAHSYNTSILEKFYSFALFSQQRVIADSLLDEIVHHDTQGRCALMCALDMGDMEGIKNMLVDGSHENFDAIDSQGQTVLMHAVDSFLHNWRDLPEEWIDELFGRLIPRMKHETIRRSDSNGSTVLIHAINGGNLRIVQKTLEILDADTINAVDRFGNSVLIHAIESQNRDIFETVLCCEKFSFQGNQSGLKGCKRALEVKNEEMALALFNRLCVEYSNILNPLSIAISVGFDAKIRQLINHSDLNFQSRNFGETALMMAIKFNATPLASVLIQKMDPIGLELCNNEGKTALMMALEHKMYGIALKLVKRMRSSALLVEDKGRRVFGGVIRWFSTRGQNAVDVALSHKIDTTTPEGLALMSVLSVLFERISDEDLQKQGDSKWIVLAIKKGHHFIVRRLLSVFNYEQGFLINMLRLCSDEEMQHILENKMMTFKGVSPLMRALITNDNPLIQDILKNGSPEDFSAVDDDGRTVLMYAVANQPVEVIHQILSQMDSRLINVTSKGGETVVSQAIGRDDIAIVRELLSCKKLDFKRIDCESLLHRTLSQKNYLLAHELMDRMDPEVIIENSEKILRSLSLSIDTNYIPKQYQPTFARREQVSDFLNKFLGQFKVKKHPCFIVFMKVAIEVKHSELQKKLLQYSFNLRELILLFQHAVKCKIEESEHLILEKLRKKDRKLSPLMIALISQDDERIFNLLQDESTDFNVLDKERRTALTYAIQNLQFKRNEREVLGIILDRMDLSLLNVQDSEGKTGLMRVIEFSRTMRSSQEELLSLEQRLIHTLPMMTSEGINCRGKDGKTTWMHVEESGLEKLGRALLEQMSPETLRAESKEGSIFSLLHSSHSINFKNMFFAKACQVYAGDLSPLVIALKCNFKQKINELFAGASPDEINQRTSDGCTALMFACRGTFGHQFINHGAVDLNCIDGRGWTALMYAIDAGRLANVKSFFTKGNEGRLDLSIPGNSTLALELAHEKGDGKIIAFLTQKLAAQDEPARKRRKKSE